MSIRCPSCGRYRTDSEARARRMNIHAQLKREIKRGKLWRLFHWVPRKLIYRGENA